MRALLIILSISIAQFACVSQSTSSKPQLTLGAYKLDAYLHLLKGKNIGLVVNQTSTINNTHLVDTLLKHGVSILKVFSPEHGFRGNADAGEKVKDGIDLITNLPIISLYGSNKKPTAEQLSDIDVVIFDIQDVGTRFYTYISTMHYVMEACAENNKQVIILDRPNPNGMYVDGPVLDMKFQSFVGMHPIPILHGLTVGELALMINGEDWLKDGLICKLKVIPITGWDHTMKYSLPVKPSPNLPNDLSIQLYPSLCLFEGTEISVGRGTYSPFQQIGHPSLIDMKDNFTPVSIEGMSKYPKHQDKVCNGVKFNKNNSFKGMDLSYLIQFYNNFEDKENFFIHYFNTLAGNSTLQEQIKTGKTEEQIKDSWQEKLNTYKAIRQKYLLYPDFE